MNNANSYSYSVDVIIPVYKPDTNFHKLIKTMVNQDCKPKHIFLLLTIEDNKKEQLEETKKYKTLIEQMGALSSDECMIECTDINKSDFDHGGTRNFGASKSKADIILFMTQDATPKDHELVKNIIKPFYNEKIAASYARQLPTPKADIIEKFTREFNYPGKSNIKSIDDLPKLGIKTYFCSNVCAAYRKSVYDMMGGFVNKTIFNEDMIMAATMINAGYSIAYTADAQVYHSHVYTYRQQFKRNFDLAVSQKQYSSIFDKVKSENEGMKLVKKTMDHLIKQKKLYLIPDLIFQSGFKYLGYKAGKHYEVFPDKMIKKLSMNPSYWEKS